MFEKYDILIIGGGLSGLATAYRLRNSNLKIGLIESSSRLGGRIKTSQYRLQNGKNIKFEAGAGRFSQRHKRVKQLISDLGLSNKIGKNGKKVEFLRS